MQQSSSGPERTGRLKYVAYSGYIAFLVCATAWFIGTIAPVEASPAQRDFNPNVKLNARSLYQGNFKFGDWLPVELSLQNFSEAVEVQVEANVKTRINGVEYSTVYQRETSLGERANKKLLLYIVPFVETTNASRSVKYEGSVVLKAGDRKLAEQKIDLRPLSPTDYLVGVMSQNPDDVVNSLSNLKVGGGQRYRVTSINLPLADIADQALGLRSFDTIIISETNTEGLTTDQRSALREWVENGGQLLLMGGNGWGRVRAGISQNLLPLDVTNYTNIPGLDNLSSPNGELLGDKGPFRRPATLVRGQVVKDARLLSYWRDGSSIVPIAAEKRLGSGRIVALSLDFSISPLLEWSNTEQFWQELFAFNLTPFNQIYTENNPHLKNAQDMLTNISSVPELRLPNITPFLAIFFVYLMLVAPLNYLLLKKINRLELAWLSIPAITITFLLITLNYANSQPPGQILISQMSMVQTGSDQEMAQVRSYAGIFSPEDRRYNISPVPPVPDVTVRTLMTPLNRAISSPAEADPNRTVIQGERARLEDFQIGQWSSQGFSMETAMPARLFQVTADLHYEEGKITGTVRNNTGTALRNVILMIGDHPQRFRDVIEAGEVVPVDFNLPSPTQAVQAFCNFSSSSSTSFANNTPADRLQNALLQDRRDDKVLQSRANFLRKVYESGRYSPLNNQRGLDLIGWMDQNPLPLVVDGLTSYSKTNQVLIARLPVGLETSSGDGRLLLPSMAFFPETVVSSSGQLALTNRTDRTDQLCLGNGRGMITMQFRLPVDQSVFKVKQMTLYLNSFQTNGRREPILPELLEMYNFKENKWEPLANLSNSLVTPPSGGNFIEAPPPVKNVIGNAARFTDPVTGRIMLRMNYNSGTNQLFVQHGLEVEGTRN